MSASSVPVHGPAPAPLGPIVCTLSPNLAAGRLEAFRRDVFDHLRAMERPEPTRLRLVLGGRAELETVRALLVREQQCCAFLGFTLTPGDGGLVADLEVREEAAPTLDALVQLAVPGR